MALERNWQAVPPRLFTSNGTAQSVVTISDTSGFYTKSVVSIKSDSQPPSNFQVLRVLSATQMLIGSLTAQIGKANPAIDLSIYTVADNATIEAGEQKKNNIPSDDHYSAVYEADPVVADRVINVDKHGKFYDENNRLPVDASVTVVVPPLTVDLDALTPPDQADPDNILIAGSEDGTKSGNKHAVRVDSELDLRVGISDGANKATVDADGKLSVSDVDAQTLLASVLAQLQSGSLSIGTEDGTETGVQHVFVNNLKIMILASQDRNRDVTYLDPTSRKNRRVEKFEYTSATFPGVTLVRTFNYNLIGSDYVFVNDNWTLI